MEERTGNISVGARVTALAALLLASLVVFVAVLGILDGDGESTGNGGDTPSLADVPKRYEVKAGDTLSSISEKTGVPMSTIEELNPEIDPQALIEGQELKLR